MTTLVATLDLHLSDRRHRRKLEGMRASFGELERFNQSSFSMELGDSLTFEVTRFFFAYFRDPVTLELFSSDGNSSIIIPEIAGVFSLPAKGKIIVSVDAASTISLARVVQVIYS